MPKEKEFPRKKFILSIDGGGMRGLIPLYILREIEKRTGRNTLEMFDLFAGTSTGGLIVLALNALNQKNQTYSVEEIIEFYENEGHRMFQRSHYSQEKKMSSLLLPLGVVTSISLLYILKKRLAITSPDIVKTCFFGIAPILISETVYKSAQFLRIPYLPVDSGNPIEKALRFLGVGANAISFMALILPLVSATGLFSPPSQRWKIGAAWSCTVLIGGLGFFSGWAKEAERRNEYALLKGAFDAAWFAPLAFSIARYHSISPLADLSILFFNTGWNLLGRILSQTLVAQYLCGAKFSSPEHIVLEIFGEQTMKDLNKHVAVPARRLMEDSSHTHVFTNNDQHQVKDVALATSAAPTYFPVVRIGNFFFTDGGFGAQFPAEAAIKHWEKSNELRHNEKEIFILALGTGKPGNNPNAFYRSQMNFMDYANAIKRVGDVDNHLRETYNEDYFRIDPELNESIPLDDYQPVNLEKMKNAAKQYIEQNEQEFQRVCNILKNK